MTEGQYLWYQYWFLYKIAPPPQYLPIDYSHSTLQYNWEISILTFITLLKNNF